MLYLIEPRNITYNQGLNQAIPHAKKRPRTPQGSRGRLGPRLNSHGPLGYNLTPGTDYGLFNGDIGAGILQSLGDNPTHAGTTWHLHDNDGDAFYISGGEYISEFCDIGIHIIKLRTPHHHHLASQKITVEIWVGQGRTVCRHQQISIL